MIAAPSSGADVVRQTANCIGDSMWEAKMASLTKVEPEIAVSGSETRSPLDLAYLFVRIGAREMWAPHELQKHWPWGGGSLDVHY